MPIAVQIIAVFAISGLSIYLLYKGWSPVVTPALMAVLLLIFSGTNPLTGMMDIFLGGFTQVVPMFLLYFLAGSIMGALVSRSGAAESIADTLFRLFVSKRTGRTRAIAGGIVSTFVCFICCYGGLDTFCAVFTLLPIVMVLAQKADVPRRLVPALMFGGISSASLGPGAPLTANNMGAMLFGTTITAAPVIGVIGMISVLALIIWFTFRRVGKAYDRNERFEIGAYKMPEPRPQDERPHFVLAILPFVAVFICSTIIGLAAYLCLTVGTVVCIICFTPYIYRHCKKETQEGSSVALAVGRSLVGCLNEGGMNGGNAFLIIATGSAFASVVGASQGLNVVLDALISLPIPTVIVFAAVIIVFTFLSGSPGCMIVAAPVFLPLLDQMGGIGPAGLMRIAVFGQCVLDTLPMNGAILIVTASSGLTMKESYPGIFRTTVLYMFIGTVVVTALAMLFPGLA